MRAGLCIVLGLAIGLDALGAGTNYFEEVKAEARRLARAPYAPSTNAVPAELLKLDYVTHKQITFRETEVFWKKRQLPFEVTFFHPGYVHKDVVHLNELTAGQSLRIPFSTNYFDYGTNRFSFRGDPGFSGLTLYHTPANFGEVGSFLGASYFRMIGKGQSWGGSARGLALDTGLPKPEEFPVFKEYWLERPKTNDNTLTLYALMDSPSVAGAFRFVIEPDRTTVTTVHAAFFVRKETERFGVAPLTSMFLYGENSHPPFSDFRPEVHDSDGLLVESKDQEWLWRPLENGKMVRMNSYRTDHLKGFGLMQRDRQFDHYMDPLARFEDRPSIWIKALGDWGEGSVELTQLPSNLEFIDNTVAFWQPAKKPKAGDELNFSYQIFWTLNDPAPANVVPVRSTWIGKVITDPPREHPNIRFVLDFDASAFPPMKDGMQLSGQVENSDGANFVADTITRIPERNLVRYVIEITEPVKATDLRARLKLGGAPVTETWTYTWQP